MFSFNVQNLKRLLKQRIKRSTIYQELRFKDRNFYKTNYPKNALLSYINSPFRTTANIQKHSNRRQARIIGETLSEFGFNVDIINFEYRGGIDYQKYDLVFGFGHPFENSFLYPTNAKRIYYATGPHFTQRNMAEILRLRMLRDRQGVILHPKRQKPYPEIISATLADAIFCTGNDWTISTFRKYFDRDIYRTPIGIHKQFPLHIFDRNIEQSKRNFLWIGGDGLVFKGLDLCIEAFENLPNANLHICGTMEEEFKSLYKTSLSSKNIFYHGHVDVTSNKFRQICETCSYVIYPGSSEAGCGAVLTAMSTGLIPVITKETSIDIDSFGHLIEVVSVSGISNLVNSLVSVEINEHDRRSVSSANYVETFHSFKLYDEAFRTSLSLVLSR